MTTNDFVKELKVFLTVNTDKDHAEKVKAYLYSDLKHYGVNTTKRRQWMKIHRSFLKELSKKEMLELVQILWDQPSFEEKTSSVEILNIHVKEFDKSDMPLIEKMMRESKGWALLDNLIIPVMPVILEKDSTVYSVLKKWIKDDDFWVRRSAILSQLLFFRHDNGGDRDLFFKLSISQFDESWIEQVYHDKVTIKRARFFIRKAIGWTLREMSIRQPDIVFNFLKENKDDMSGLSFREGSRKLPKEYFKKLIG